jgi:phytoene synthase
MSERSQTREAYRHCETIVRTHDKDRYLASLFAPAARRPFLYALYAFAIEIARVKLRVRDPLTGTIRLRWWHEALNGLRAEEAAANPVMVALLDASQQTSTSLTLLTAAVEAREAELLGLPTTAAEASVVAAAAEASVSAAAAEASVVAAAEASVSAAAAEASVSAAAAEASVFVAAARMLGANNGTLAAAAQAAARAVSAAEEKPEQARLAYAAFRADVGKLPEQVLPALLTVALVPLRLAHPHAAQWRRQIALLRAAWFGFPTL